MAVSPDLRLRFLGSLLGTAVGDCLGAGRWFGRELAPHYTDDTHMMIGVAESLIAREGFDREHMLETFVRNWEREPWRGYGPGPLAIFMAYRRGEDPSEVARNIYPGGSYGNGAAMRVAPIACLYHDDLEELRRVVYEASDITHKHPLGKEGAFLQAAAIALAIRAEPGRLDPQGFVEELEGLVEHDIYIEKLRTIRRFLSSRPTKRQAIEELGNTVEAFNSVPTAIYAFLAHDQFTSALIYAVGLEGDSDTIGAMTGAIAGAYHGASAIPPRWLDQLENRAYIEHLAVRLWVLKTKRAGVR